MLHRDEASWNIMTSGFVQAGLYPETVELFHEMRVQGSKPNGFVLVGLITACNRSAISMVSQGIQIHGFVVKFGLLSNVFISSSLLHFYGTYGFMSTAQIFFEEMPERNTVSWTSLMVDYSTNGDPKKVVEIYKRMRCEAVSCNRNSFSTVISSCGLLKYESLGLQVLTHVVVSGFESNVSVSNSLISMFGNFGNIEDAYYIFDQIEERDIISWNSMILAYSDNWLCEEALRCFHCMRCTNVKPNSTTVCSLVSACSSADEFKWGRGIHGLALKHGFDSFVCASTALVTMYSESGRCEDAKLLFREMPVKDLVSWNAMMATYVQNREFQGALKCLAELLLMSTIRNNVAFASALAACSSHEALTEGKTVHALTIRIGLHEDLLIGNALVTMYGKCGMMREAKQVFRTMPECDVVTWNALIGGFIENEEPQKAIKAFNLMRKDDMSANYITIVNVLGSCSCTNDLLNYGMPIHANIVLTGFERDSYVQNSLLTMYAKCGDIDSSNFIFDRLDNKNVVSWNAIIAANAHHGYGEEALKHFVEMHRVGFEFDRFSFSGGFAACASLALLEEGQQLYALVIKLGFESDLHVTNAAMDMYGKCGEMKDVLQMLPKPSNRSRLSWNILISAFSRHGYFKKAMETFHQMLQFGLKPDHITFISLLTACNHGGLMNEGLAYFSSMTSEFNILPEIEHCVCIIDLLGRSGRLIDAEKFIEKMPVPPDDLVWRSLLASCRTHNDLELGKKAAKHLLELDMLDESAYVLLSNVCAINGRWEDMENIRRKMDLNNIIKKLACSWLRVKNKSSSV